MVKSNVNPAFGGMLLYRFHLKIYGCQMNSHDAEKLRGALLARRWIESSEEEADCVVYVACSIRDKAEHKVWSELGRHEERWNAEQRPIVAVTSCIAQNVGDEMARRFPWVRVISGPRHLGDLPDALETACRTGDRLRLLDDDPRAVRELPVAPMARINPWKASVTISHGCDNFCTYCIVPHVRGRFASRSKEDILTDVKSLIDHGVKEVSLLGQNVDTWGLDLGPGVRFSHLLDEVASLPGLKWLRFMTSYPSDFTIDVCEVMQKHPNICRAINLPIQAGSNRVLRAMNRRYTLEEYAATVDLIRSFMPDVGLTSDLIVGFPGETDEEFQASVDALERFQFDLVHTAAYSPRQGTPAAKMKNQVSEEEKNRRLRHINEVQARVALQVNQRLIGEEFDVLLDGYAPKGDYIQGRTGSDKVVLLPKGTLQPGQFVRAKIEDCTNWCLKGREA